MKPLFHALSGLCINLSAAWFGAAFFTRGFFSNPDWLLTLITYMIYGMLFLYVSVALQQME